MDKILFKEAIDKVYNLDKEKDSIGILEEKTVHSVLKFYYGNNIENQEIKIDKYVADVKVDNTIYEIQTRSFYKLTDKLNRYIRLHYDINVVYPVIYIKWYKYLNDDFSYTNRKRSPRCGSKYDIIEELYSIREFLKYNFVTFQIPLLEVEEIRIKKDGKWNKSNKIDRFPIDIIDEIIISKPSDLLSFLPDHLPAQFTSLHIAKLAHIPLKIAQLLLLLLVEQRLIEKIGNLKKYYLYQIVTEEKIIDLTI